MNTFYVLLSYLHWLQDFPSFFQIAVVTQPPGFFFVPTRNPVTYTRLVGGTTKKTAKSKNGASPSLQV